MVPAGIVTWGLASETWYFHHGAPIYLHLFHEDDYSDLILGDPVDQPSASK
jgi:predicted cupin superfamily sugar epimerase